MEGLPAIIGALLTYYPLPSRPAEATFLAQDEKEWIRAELASEAERNMGEHSALRALAHPRVWHLASVQFGYAIGFYGMGFYMPQAIKTLASGYSNTVVGILVMIPYLAGVAAMILVSGSSDRTVERPYHAAIPLLVQGIALASLGVARSPLISMILWSFAAMGLCSYGAPFWSIPSKFLTGFSAASGIGNSSYRWINFRGQVRTSLFTV